MREEGRVKRETAGVVAAALLNAAIGVVDKGTAVLAALERLVQCLAAALGLERRMQVIAYDIWPWTSRTGRL